MSYGNMILRQCRQCLGTQNFTSFIHSYANLEIIYYSKLEINLMIYTSIQHAITCLQLNIQTYKRNNIFLGILPKMFRKYVY